jgi:DNA-binding NarL/FixJ family response regulator
VPRPPQPGRIIGIGLIGFIGPEVTRLIPPPAFPGNTPRTLTVLGAAIALAGVAAAPLLLRGYSLLTRMLLGPAGQGKLALRVRQLTQTRTEALDTGAAEIRRIERDLHDGAQARLVAMGMTLDAAGQIIDSNPDAARALVLEARDASVKALAELRALVRGIHPPVLADRGLADAIRALALDTTARISLASDLNARPPAPVESAVYFAVCGLLANVSKHAEAGQTWVDIRHTDGMLRIGVTDNGHGGAEPARGTGLRGIERRAGRLRRSPRDQQPTRRPDRGHHGGPVRVVIAEDLFLLRDGLTRMLQAHGLQIAAAVDNGTDLLAAVTADQPDVTIVDVRLPPTFTDEGIRAALAARREVPGLPVLVLSQYVEQLYARELLASGSGGIGYLLKDRVFDSGQFVDAVRRVAAGGTAMDPEVIARLLARNTGDGTLATLSPREREVLALMAEGRSNAAIAQRMVITERAVAKHTASIFLKLDLQPSDDDNRGVLAVLAYLGG